jgi:hypothetical protein
VEIGISVAGGDTADLESLEDWLRGEDVLAGRVRLAGSRPGQFDLGALAETLIVAVGSGGAVGVVGAALAGALKAWLSQPGRSDVTLKIRRPDGTSVELAAKRVRAGEIDIEATIRQALGTGPQGGTTGAAARAGSGAGPALGSQPAPAASSGTVLGADSGAGPAVGSRSAPGAGSWSGLGMAGDE